MTKTYDELIQFKTFEERLGYLKLSAHVGDITFGGSRYLNQSFYKSQEWRTIRNEVIDRDFGFDLGLPGYNIFGKVFVHHMNPVTKRAVKSDRELLLDPRYLITCSFETHQIIHFGFSRSPKIELVERTPGDTTLW